MQSKFIVGALLVFFVTSMFNSQSAFAGSPCEFQCGLEADDFFNQCLVDTGGDVNLCGALASSFFDQCIAQCPGPNGCFFDEDCGIPTACSQFICEFGQCIDIGPGDGAPCGPGDVCFEEVCLGGQCTILDIPNDTPCGINDACESNVCLDGACFPSLTNCDDGDVCTIDSCDPASGCQQAPNPVCEEKVGGVLLPLDNTSLLLAGLNSEAVWMIPVVLSVLGIGLFVVSRKSE